jgi:hypothetical protein
MGGTPGLSATATLGSHGCLVLTPRLSSSRSPAQGQRDDGCQPAPAVAGVSQLRELGAPARVCRFRLSQRHRRTMSRSSVGLPARPRFWIAEEPMGGKQTMARADLVCSRSPLNRHCVPKVHLKVFRCRPGPNRLRHHSAHARGDQTSVPEPARRDEVKNVAAEIDYDMPEHRMLPSCSA